VSEQSNTCQARKGYNTDVTDGQWALVAGPDPSRGGEGRGRAPTNLREILNTILYQKPHGLPVGYVARTTCAPGVPPVDYYQAWQTQGVWDLLVETLRSQLPRRDPPRGPQPKSRLARKARRQRLLGSKAKGQPARKSKPRGKRPPASSSWTASR